MPSHLVDSAFLGNIGFRLLSKLQKKPSRSPNQPDFLKIFFVVINLLFKSCTKNKIWSISLGKKNKSWNLYGKTYKIEFYKECYLFTYILGWHGGTIYS